MSGRSGTADGELRHHLAAPMSRHLVVSSSHVGGATLCWSSRKRAGPRPRAGGRGCPGAIVGDHLHRPPDRAGGRGVSRGLGLVRGPWEVSAIARDIRLPPLVLGWYLLANSYQNSILTGMEGEAQPEAGQLVRGRCVHDSNASPVPGIPRRAGCRRALGPPARRRDGDDAPRLAQDSPCDLVDGAGRPGTRRLPGPRGPGRVRRRPLLGCSVC